MAKLRERGGSQPGSLQALETSSLSAAPKPQGRSEGLLTRIGDNRASSKSPLFAAASLIGEQTDSHTDVWMRGGLASTNTLCGRRCFPPPIIGEYPCS